MKAVLISIHPKWCELIASGKKTVEVRKTKPKLETPFKVYIYETQGRTETPFVDEEGHEIFKGRGQVIGEFVCNQFTYIEAGYDTNLKKHLYNTAFIEHRMCIPDNELHEYLYKSRENCGGWAWHISKLVIYDKPKELAKFRHECDGVCIDTKRKIKCRRIESDGLSCNGLESIKRPPQSWCYVEGGAE